MARKARSRTAAAPRKTSGDNQLAKAVTQSAQKIWLAGLGAFGRARNEGDKLFDMLVEQGRTLRLRTEKAADKALKTVRNQADATVATAQGKWDKLEEVFEDRVSRSLNRLGVLSSKDVEDLARQVADLNESVRSLMAGGGTTKRAVRKAPAKSRAKKRSPRRTAK